MSHIILTLLLCVLAIKIQAQDIRSQLQSLANDLSKQIEVKGKKRVVIASFLNLKNKETELGRYMADKFSTGLVKSSTSLQLIDRSQLAQVLRDNKLGADRILDPKTIPVLGRLTGAEVIIIGNYTVLDNSLDVTVKAIDLERGLTLAVSEGTVPKTSEVNKLINEIESIKPDENSPAIPAKINCKGRNSAGALITLKECFLNSRTLTCQITVSNDRKDRADAQFGYYDKSTYTITDNKRQYEAYKISIGNTASVGYMGSGYTSVFGVDVDGEINFEVQDSSIKLLQIFEMRDQGLRCTNIPVSSTNK